MAENQETKSSQIAGTTFSPENKDKKNETDQGLAKTHEQVVDYYEDGTIENENDRD
ncbi:YozQ family protein [Peribacillus kribbensis]|uniref:YozQ family protein n=1 Tax=Peribacillus kribbensis TaxID=356658 RepID=UPI0003F599A6|nr:YozQ family protein [Peribacillus kribbensis]